jgi:CubicO group peptidase (beta-lactamase class C family)
MGRDVLLALVCFFTLMISPEGESHETGIDPSAFPVIDAICQNVVDQGYAPGISLRIGRVRQFGSDEILYEKNYGTREGTHPTTSDTLYDLASVTKASLTTNAVALLIEEGLLSEDDYVYTHIPGFEQNGKGNIQIWHLLTHTSGLPAGTSRPSSPPRPSADALIAKINSLSLSYTTGEGYTYSDLSMVLLSRVVENITGMSMHHYLKENLYDQIGMINSTHYPTTAQKNHTAPTSRGTGIVHDPTAWYYTDYEDEDDACGNAGGFSTIEDESRVARMLLHQGKLFNKQLLSPSLAEKLTTRQTDNASRSYGWGVLTDSRTSNPENAVTGQEAIGHSGWTGPYMWMDKYSGVYAIYLANSVYPTDSSANRSGNRSASYEVIKTIQQYLDIYNNVPQEGVVIDNDEGSPAYIETGDWTTSGNMGYLEKTYRYAEVGTSSYADYHFEIEHGGLYRISTWYLEHSSRATSSRYEITHPGGETSVLINQQVNGAQWVKLTDLFFEPGAYRVRVNPETSSGGTYVAADAILVECLKREGDGVVDNEDAGFTVDADFGVSSSSPLRYGNNYHYLNPGLPGSATWSLSLPDAGVYEIFEWHNGNSTRSDRAPFTIHHADGQSSVEVNQQKNSGRWISLGRYRFEMDGGVVSLSGVEDRIVIADAVRARRVGHYELIIDDLDGRYSDSAGFFASSASSLRYDATYRACETGTGELARWELNLPFAGVWEIYEMHNGTNTSRSTDAPFTVIHSLGSTPVAVNQQENSGEWNYLGEYTFTAGGGEVTLGNEGNSMYVIADAVRAVYVEDGQDVGLWQLY